MNKYNQKHLTISDRLYIEQELLQETSFKAIAKVLHKDPTTISKEVKRARTLIPYDRFARKCRLCHFYSSCSDKNLCHRTKVHPYFNNCNATCKKCYRWNPQDECPNFLEFTCNKCSKAPYVCNACPKERTCFLEHYFYNAKKAQRLYAKYQRCTVHFYRNIFSATPRKCMKEVSMMLKAIHAQESKVAAREKAVQVAAKLREMKLPSAAKKLEDGIDETLTYMDFPSQHWSRIRTNNTIERLNREIKRRTKAIGAFPDGQSALMLVCARLRHVAGTQWGAKRYMNMDHLYELDVQDESDFIAG